jgi:hypothetical protein
MSKTPEVHVWWHDDVLDHDAGEGPWELERSDLPDVQELHP